MKVLYISNKPIYPSVDGGCMAMRQFLNCLLNTGAEIKHLCISTDKHSYDEHAYPSAIREKIQPEGIYLDTRVRFRKALPYLFKRSSYNVDRFDSPQFRRRILAVLSENQFDCVILESLFVTPYLDTIRASSSARVLVRTHNVEADIWQDLADNTRSPLKRNILRRLTRDLRRYEIATLNKADGLLTITENDAKRFSQLGVKTSAETIPVAVSPGQVPQTLAGKLFHLGAMDWSPNQRAVRKILRVFPNIRKEVPKAELHIAGRHAVRFLQQLEEPGVFVQDFVNDAAAFMRECGILAAPIDSGSGIRIKILEAMAQGLAVVTTSKGAQGLEHLKGECLLICTNDKEFTEACVSLLRSEEKRLSLGQSAYAYIQSAHSEAQITKKLREFLERT